MKKYTDEGELERVICNGCGKKIIVSKGIIREGAFSVDYNWDYFSEKDGEIHHWDLCEECYNRLLGDFCISAEVEEQVEFI